MNPLLNFIQKRPSDITIRIIRVLLWLIIVSSLYYNFFVQENPNTIQNELFWISISENTQMIIMYIMVAIWLIPLIMWAMDLCFLKSKYVRIWEIIFAVILFYFSHIIIETPNMDIDVLLFFLAFIPLFWWITWKFITTKCRNYWYKQTKIRV